MHMYQVPNAFCSALRCPDKMKTQILPPKRPFTQVQGCLALSVMLLLFINIKSCGERIMIQITEVTYTRSVSKCDKARTPPPQPSFQLQFLWAVYSIKLVPLIKVTPSPLKCSGHALYYTCKEGRGEEMREEGRDKRREGRREGGDRPLAKYFLSFYIPCTHLITRL